LPEARSDKYVATMFPNSQSAGLLKTEEGETMKRVAPLYYFCLPLPEALTGSNVSDLEPSPGDARRVNVRIDRTRKLLYLVYFPEQESPGGAVVLRLKVQHSAEQPRRLAK
jgi:hypothetical protein